MTYQLLRRCANPPCHHLTEFDYCSVKCQQEAKGEIRVCACGCGKTFTPDRKNPNKKFFNNDCSIRSRIKQSDERRRQKMESERNRRERERAMYGPDNPLNPPWTPRPKPPPLMTDEEQIDINMREHIRDWKRMDQPLTMHVARMMGAAW